MKNKNISFSGNFLSKDDLRLHIDEFKEVIGNQYEQETFENEVHSFDFQFIDSYLKILFSVGTSLPRNPNVINTNTHQTEPNPRGVNQAEPQEFFAIIDFDESLLWISNGHKRNLLIDFFRKKFKKSRIVVKDVYDEELFLDTIQRIDELRITSTPDLLSQTNTISKALSDEINQFEAIEGILHLKYQDKFMGDSIVKKIKSVFANKEKFRGLMLSGRDDQNNKLLFNANVISKRIDFHVSIDSNEMYIPEEVFEILMQKLNDGKN